MRVWNQPGYVFHQCDMRYGFVHNGALSFGCGVPINPQMADHFYDLKLSMAWRPGEFHPSPPFMQDSVSNTFGGLKTWRHNQQTLLGSWPWFVIHEITPVILYAPMVRTWFMGYHRHPVVESKQTGIYWQSLYWWSPPGHCRSLRNKNQDVENYWKAVCFYFADPSLYHTISIAFP